jgi:hypothetical protein
MEFHSGAVRRGIARTLDAHNRPVRPKIADYGLCHVPCSSCTGNLLYAAICTDQNPLPVVGQFDFTRTEAGNRHADAILIFAAPLDVIRRPVRSGTVFQHIEQAIKADGGPKQGSKIVISHNHILLEAIWQRTPALDDGALAEPLGLDDGEVIQPEIFFKRSAMTFLATDRGSFGRERGLLPTMCLHCLSCQIFPL